MNSPLVASGLAEELSKYIRNWVETHNGDTRAVRPGNRVEFFWPPHPESYGYHLQPSDWTGRSTLQIGNEQFEIETAACPSGLFGKIPELWFEARGADEQELKAKLEKGVAPLLARQHVIAAVLERPIRFTGHVNELGPIDLLKLLYCSDRDVVNDGRREIETHASLGIFLEPLIVVLKDRIHPNRRSAQWAVLDMFEDLGCFTKEEEDFQAVVALIKALIWDAEDDYARTIYKAGVVLGGHLPYGNGAEALLSCLNAPSKIGRRSAIHGLYHLAEWSPEHREEIVESIGKTAKTDPDPQLRNYAAAMTEDIERADTNHAEDIQFPDEE